MRAAIADMTEYQVRNLKLQSWFCCSDLSLKQFIWLALRPICFIIVKFWFRFGPYMNCFLLNFFSKTKSNEIVVGCIFNTILYFESTSKSSTLNGNWEDLQISKDHFS
jgi:hypothetical protein